MMTFHYGPARGQTTSYGEPLRGATFAYDTMRTSLVPRSGVGANFAYDTMRTRPIRQGTLGENYVYDTMRTRPIPMRGFGDITATATTGLNSAVKKVLEFGAGYVLGSAMAPAAKDKVIYGMGGGLTSMMFGVIGLGVGALALAQVKK